MNTRIEEAISTIICLQKKNQEIVESINFELTNIAKANNVERNIGFFDNYEPDSSPLAWLYYTTVYQDMELPLNEDVYKGFFGYRKRFPDNCGFKKDGNPKRIIGTYGNVDIAGDCAFNFNEKKFAEFCKKILLDKSVNEVQKEKVLILLFHCNNMHHSVFNFILMPRTGKLNNVKGMKVCDPQGFDRLDSFIYWLGDFYKIIPKKNRYDHRVLNCSAEPNKTVILNFLNSFDSIENFCKVFYNIDSKETKDSEGENLYDKLLKNGNESITDCESLFKYIKLAVDFWEHQAKHYDDCIKKNLSAKGDE